jgi:integrase
MFRGQRVPGLYARTGKRGTTYQAMLRHDGRLLSKKLKAHTEAEARAEVALALASWKQDAEAPTSLTFGALAEEYRVQIQEDADKGTRSARGAAEYLRRLDAYVLPALRTKRVQEIEGADVISLLRKLEADGLGESSRKGTLAVVSAVFEYGRKTKQRTVTLNPARNLPSTPQPSQMDPIELDRETVRALVMATTPRHRPIVGLCAYSGLRISEALGLVWGDVEIEEGKIGNEIHVSAQRGRKAERVRVKTRRAVRTVPLGGFGLELLAWRWQEAKREGRAAPGDFCFPTASGAPVDRVHVASAWRTARAKLGREDVRIHDLRHAFGYWAIETVGVHQASQWLGHSDSAFTGRVYGQRALDSSVARENARRLYAVA